MMYTLLYSLSDGCLEEEKIRTVSEKLRDILRKGNNQNICKAFNCIRKNDCLDHLTYQNVLNEVYYELPKYIKDDFYDLTGHAKKMKTFYLAKESTTRYKKGFLLSVANLTFRAVASDKLPPDITIELMKEKFENLDVEGKYYFKGLSDEEWKVLLNYHNYLQTSLHYVKADTNDLPLMESSAFLAGIHKCLQGSFKSLGKEAKRLHIIYKELKTSQDKPCSVANFLQQSEGEANTDNDDDSDFDGLDDYDNLSVDLNNTVPYQMGSFTMTVKQMVNENPSTIALPEGTKIMDILHVLPASGTGGKKRSMEMTCNPLDVNAHEEKRAKKEHHVKGAESHKEVGSNDVADHHNSIFANDAGIDYEGIDYEGIDNEGIDSNCPIGGFTESIVHLVKKNPTALECHYSVSFSRSGGYRF